MKKPINKFAVAMWVVAAIVAILNVVTVYSTLESIRTANQTGMTYFIVRGFLNALVGTIAPVAMLVGFGALIELVDQICWNTRPKP